jgi:hypothetical protein
MDFPYRDQYDSPPLGPEGEARNRVIEAAKAFIEHEYHDPEISTRYRFALRGTVEALLDAKKKR